MTRTTNQANARATALIPMLPAYTFTTLVEAITDPNNLYRSNDVGKIVEADDAPGLYLVDELLAGGGAKLLPVGESGTVDVSVPAGPPVSLPVVGPSVRTLVVTLLDAALTVVLGDTIDVVLFDGQIIEVKDGALNAATNNITIDPQSKTIQGAGTLVLNTNGAVVKLIFNETLDEWLILNQQ
jgi:hypothetical protein